MQAAAPDLTFLVIGECSSVLRECAQEDAERDKPLLPIHDLDCAGVIGLGLYDDRTKEVWARVIDRHPLARPRPRECRLEVRPKRSYVFLGPRVVSLIRRYVEEVVAEKVAQRHGRWRQEVLGIVEIGRYVETTYREGCGSAF